MAILQTSDFVGNYKVSTSRFTELQWYIDNYEKYYLTRLLGADLYTAFIADLTGTTPQIPQTTRFIELFNSFISITSYTSSLVISEGIKTMLIQFVYFHYVRNSNQYNSIAGQVVPSNENSGQANYLGTNLIEVYNQGVVNYINIQLLAESDASKYPEIKQTNPEYLHLASGI